MRCFTVLNIVLFAGLFSLAFGQNGHGGHRQRMSVEQRVAQLDTELALSPDQATKITSIMEKQRDTMLTIRDKYGDDREGMREEMAKLRANLDNSILAVLTDTQRKKYQEIVAQRQQWNGSREKGNGQ